MADSDTPVALLIGSISLEADDHAGSASSSCMANDTVGYSEAVHDHKALLDFFQRRGCTAQHSRYNLFSIVWVRGKYYIKRLGWDSLGVFF